MATEKVTEHPDGSVERTVERDSAHTTVVERGGGGGGAGLLIALAVIVFLAIAAWFLFNANQNEAMEADAVADAASSVAGSVDNAADSVAGAADRVTVPDVDTPEVVVTEPAPAE